MGTCLSDGSACTLLQETNPYQGSSQYSMARVQIQTKSAHFETAVPCPVSHPLPQLTQPAPGLHASALSPGSDAIDEHPPSPTAPRGTAGCDGHIVPGIAVPLEPCTVPAPQPPATEDSSCDVDSLSLSDCVGLCEEDPEQFQNKPLSLDDLLDWAAEQGVQPGVEGDRAHQHEERRLEAQTLDEFIDPPSHRLPTNVKGRSERAQPDDGSPRATSDSNTARAALSSRASHGRTMVWCFAVNPHAMYHTELLHRVGFTGWSWKRDSVLRRTRLLWELYGLAAASA